MEQKSPPLLPEVVEVALAPGDRRTPTAYVDIGFGPLTIRFSVSRRRRGRLIVQPPHDPDNQSGIHAPAVLRDKIAAMAIEAIKRDAAVWKVIRPRW
jgi:hypothetical protein